MMVSRKDINRWFRVIVWGQLWQSPHFLIASPTCNLAIQHKYQFGRVKQLVGLWHREQVWVRDGGLVSMHSFAQMQTGCGRKKSRVQLLNTHEPALTSRTREKIYNDMLRGNPPCIFIAAEGKTAPSCFSLPRSSQGSKNIMMSQGLLMYLLHAFWIRFSFLWIHIYKIQRLSRYSTFS